MKKKILHVSHSLDIGGGPLYIRKIIDDIDNYDHFVAGNHGSFTPVLQNLLGADNVIALKGHNPFANVALLRAACRIHGIEIIHAHGRGASIYCRFLKLLALPGMKVVYTIHGFFPELLNPLKRIGYLILENLLYPLTTTFIHVSLTEQHAFKKAIIWRKAPKHIYIPNYVALETEPIPATEIRRLLNPQNVNMLFVGRLVKQKGVDILLESIRRMSRPDIHFFLIGYGPFENEVIEAASKSTNITLLGKVENAASIMALFDALLLPSRLEGMPFTLLEAVRSKIVSIVTPVRGIVDVVDANSSYMARSLDPEHFSEAVIQFVNDFRTNRAVIDRKVNIAYSRLQNEFSRQVVLEKFNAVYEALG